MPRLTYILVEHPESFSGFEHFTEALRRIKTLGYAGVELLLTDPAGVELPTLRRLTEAMDLPVVSFLTGLNYFREGLCLSSPDATVRARAVERLRWSVEAGADFGALVVVGQMQGFLSDEPDKATGEARIEACLREVVETAERLGVTLVMEPVNHLQAGFHNSLAEVMALTARVDSPRFKPMLDTFHINIEETTQTEPIQRVGHEMAHFHLCETNGSFLGTGHLDVRATFDALDAVGYAGCVSLKIYRHPWHVAAEQGIQYLQRSGVA